jgi:hypothetical protein
LTVSLTPERREILVNELQTWLTKKRFVLLEAASLCGLLSDAAQINRWAWPLFYQLRNALSEVIRARHHQGIAIARRKGLRERYNQELPAPLWKRIDKLVAQDIAQYIWRHKCTMQMTPEIHAQLLFLHAYLADDSNPWEISIGHIIPRVPQWITAGDASTKGGGALSFQLEFVFDVIWSADITKGLRLNPKARGYVHINQLEMVVIIFQLSAVIQLLEDKLVTPQVGVPLLRIMTDNMTSRHWAKTASAKLGSHKGQLLVNLYAMLLRRTHIGIEPKYINTKDNVKPDYISRLDPDLSSADRLQQIVQLVPEVTSWRSFQPSPILISYLYSVLVTGSAPTATPKRLGQFALVSSISSISFTL